MTSRDRRSPAFWRVLPGITPTTPDFVRESVISNVERGMLGQGLRVYHTGHVEYKDGAYWAQFQEPEDI